MKKRSVFSLSLVVLVGTLVSWAMANAQQGDEGQKSVVGTWFIHVPAANALTVCGAPQIVVAPPPPPFVQLETFADGGTFTETNTVLNFNTASSPLGVNGSDGHGAWKAEEPGHYKLTFRKLIYAGSGQYVGNADLNEKLAVQQNTLSGTFTVTFSLLNGSQLCSSGEFSGERISIE